jgi:hypothetical protein
VVVPDIAGYDAVYKRIIRDIDIYDVSSSFSMETIKYTTALPVYYLTSCLLILYCLFMLQRARRRGREGAAFSWSSPPTTVSCPSSRC